MNKIIKFVAALLLVSLSALANAQWSPGNKPVRVVVPFPPGGGVDTVFRQIDKFAQRKGIHLVPEYRPGAEGAIGVAYGSELPKDGFNLIVTTDDAIVSKDIPKNYDPLASFDYITAVRSSIFFLVTSKQSKIETVEDLVLAVRNQSFPMNMGYNANPQKILLTQLVDSIKGGNPLLVPYKGIPQVINDLLNNTIQVAFAPGVVFASQIEAGKLNVIGTDSAQRIPNFPTAVPLNEKFPKWKPGQSMFGVVMPANSDPEAKKFWDSFFKEFINDSQAIADARKDLLVVRPFGAEIFRKSVADKL